MAERAFDLARAAQATATLVMEEEEEVPPSGENLAIQIRALATFVVRLVGVVRRFVMVLVVAWEVVEGVVTLVVG